MKDPQGPYPLAFSWLHSLISSHFPLKKLNLYPELHKKVSNCPATIEYKLYELYHLIIRKFSQTHGGMETLRIMYPD